MSSHSESLDTQPSSDRPKLELDPSLIVDLASSKALESLRESRRRQWLGFIGISSTLIILVSSVAGFLVNELLEVRVEEHVMEVIEQELGDTQFRIELGQLTLNINNLEIGLETKGISKEILINMRDEVDSFVKTYLDDPDADPKSVQIRARGITPILAKLINISAGTGLGEFVNRFYEMAPELLENNGSVTQTMVQQTGRQLIGSAGAPGSW